MIIYVIYQPVQLLLQIHRQPTDMTESIRSDHFEWIGLDRKKTAMQISNPSHLELVDDRDENDKNQGVSADYLLLSFLVTCNRQL